MNRFFLLLVCASVTVAQSPRAMIERALEHLGMEWSDVQLPSDLAGRDRHRIDAVDEVFTDPLAMLRRCEQLSRFADHLRSGSLQMVADSLSTLCGYSSGTPQLSSRVDWEYYPTNQLDSMLLRSSLVYQSIIQQYLTPLLAYRIATREVRRLIRTNELLLAMSDSLWLLSSDDEKADPYLHKAAELRGDSIAREYFDAALTPEIGSLLSGALQLYSQLLGVLHRTGEAQQLLLDSIRTIVWDTPLGRCAIGGPGDDVYRGDYVLIFDVGGNDAYFLESTKERAFERGVQVIIDLNGNDTYVGSDYSLGAGIAGCGILIDGAGDDSYRAGNYSLGSGLWGVGILYDIAGNDNYRGGTFSQGSGAFGIGILLDGGGNDHYTVAAHGQAFAGTRGVGLLVDFQGNDSYMSASPFLDVLRYESHYLTFTQGAALGYRPIASGGIALLSDRGGNDVYTTDIYGQGTAYWFGLGMLEDRSGEDRFIAYQYAQGAGIHFAHGLLWDHGGNDLYFARGVSQGCGHDVGVGMLLDEVGDDTFTVESLSLGGGNANAVSLFLDERGDDAYAARNESNTRGFSDLRRGLPMLGVFVDARGSDRYALHRGNQTAQIKSTFGIAWDAELENIETSSHRSAEPSSVDTLLPASLDSLFVLASTPLLKYQHLVGRARSAIVAQGISTVPFLATKLGTRFPRERLALEEMLPRLYRADSLAVTQLLADSLHSTNTATLLFSLWAIGKCRIAALADSMIRFARHNDWRVRAAVAQQVGEGKFRTVVHHIVRLLSDNHPWVRARAAYAVAATLGTEAHKVTLTALGDTAAIVRTSAVLGYRENTSWNPATLASLLRSAPTERGKIAVVLCAGMLDSTANQFWEHWMQFANVVAQQSPAVRAAFYRTILTSPLRCTLDGLLIREPNEELRAELSRSLAIEPCPEALPPYPRRKGSRSLR